MGKQRVKVLLRANEKKEPKKSLDAEDQSMMPEVSPPDFHVYAVPLDPPAEGGDAPAPPNGNGANSSGPSAPRTDAPLPLTAQASEIVDKVAREEGARLAASIMPPGHVFASEFLQVTILQGKNAPKDTRDPGSETRGEDFKRPWAIVAFDPESGETLESFSGTGITGLEHAEQAIFNPGPEAEVLEVKEENKEKTGEKTQGGGAMEPQELGGGADPYNQQEQRQNESRQKNAESRQLNKSFEVRSGTLNQAQKAFEAQPFEVLEDQLQGGTAELSGVSLRNPLGAVTLEEVRSEPNAPEAGNILDEVRKTAEQGQSVQEAAKDGFQKLASKATGESILPVNQLREKSGIVAPEGTEGNANLQMGDAPTFEQDTFRSRAETHNKAAQEVHENQQGNEEGASVPVSQSRISGPVEGSENNATEGETNAPQTQNENGEAVQPDQQQEAPPSGIADPGAPPKLDATRTYRKTELMQQRAASEDQVRTKKTESDQVLGSDFGHHAIYPTVQPEALDPAEIGGVDVEGDMQELAGYVSEVQEIQEERESQAESAEMTDWEKKHYDKWADKRSQLDEKDRNLKSERDSLEKQIKDNTRSLQQTSQQQHDSENTADSLGQKEADLERRIKNLQDQIARKTGEQSRLQEISQKAEEPDPANQKSLADLQKELGELRQQLTAAQGKVGSVSGQEASSDAQTERLSAQENQQESQESTLDQRDLDHKEKETGLAGEKEALELEIAAGVPEKPAPAGGGGGGGGGGGAGGGGAAPPAVDAAREEAVNAIMEEEQVTRQEAEQIYDQRQEAEAAQAANAAATAAEADATLAEGETTITDLETQNEAFALEAELSGEVTIEEIATTSEVESEATLEQAEADSEATLDAGEASADSIISSAESRASSAEEPGEADSIMADAEREADAEIASSEAEATNIVATGQDDAANIISTGETDIATTTTEVATSQDTHAATTTTNVTEVTNSTTVETGTIVEEGITAANELVFEPSLPKQPPISERLMPVEELIASTESEANGIEEAELPFVEEETAIQENVSAETNVTEAIEEESEAIETLVDENQEATDQLAKSVNALDTGADSLIDPISYHTLARYNVAAFNAGEALEETIENEELISTEEVALQETTIEDGGEGNDDNGGTGEGEGGSEGGEENPTGEEVIESAVEANTIGTEGMSQIPEDANTTPNEAYNPNDVAAPDDPDFLGQDQVINEEVGPEASENFVFGSLPALEYEGEEHSIDGFMTELNEVITVAPGIWNNFINAPGENVAYDGYVNMPGVTPSVDIEWRDVEYMLEGEPAFGIPQLNEGQQYNLLTAEPDPLTGETPMDTLMLVAGVESTLEYVADMDVPAEYRYEFMMETLADEEGNVPIEEQIRIINRLNLDPGQYEADLGALRPEYDTSGDGDIGNVMDALQDVRDAGGEDWGRYLEMRQNYAEWGAINNLNYVDAARNQGALDSLSGSLNPFATSTREDVANEANEAMALINEMDPSQQYVAVTNPDFVQGVSEIYGRAETLDMMVEMDVPVGDRLDAALSILQDDEGNWVDDEAQIAFLSMMTKDTEQYETLDFFQDTSEEGQLHAIADSVDQTTMVALISGSSGTLTDKVNAVQSLYGDDPALMALVQQTHSYNTEANTEVMRDAIRDGTTGDMYNGLVGQNETNLLLMQAQYYRTTGGASLEQDAFDASNASFGGGMVIDGLFNGDMAMAQAGMIYSVGIGGDGNPGQFMDVIRSVDPNDWDRINSLVYQLDGGLVDENGLPQTNEYGQEISTFSNSLDEIMLRNSNLHEDSPEYQEYLAIQAGDYDRADAFAMSSALESGNLEAIDEILSRRQAEIVTTFGGALTSEELSVLIAEDNANLGLVYNDIFAEEGEADQLSQDIAGLENEALENLTISMMNGDWAGEDAARLELIANGDIRGDKETLFEDVLRGQYTRAESDAYIIAGREIGAAIINGDLDPNDALGAFNFLHDAYAMNMAEDNMNNLMGTFNTEYGAGYTSNVMSQEALTPGMWDVDNLNNPETGFNNYFILPPGEGQDPVTQEQLDMTREFYGVYDSPFQEAILDGNSTPEMMEELMSQGGYLNPYQELRWATNGPHPDYDMARQIIEANGYDMEGFQEGFNEQYQGTGVTFENNVLSGDDAEANMLAILAEGAPESYLEEVYMNQQLGDLGFTGVGHNLINNQYNEAVLDREYQANEASLDYWIEMQNDPNSELASNARYNNQLQHEGYINSIVNQTDAIDAAAEQASQFVALTVIGLSVIATAGTSSPIAAAFWAGAAKNGASALTKMAVEGQNYNSGYEDAVFGTVDTLMGVGMAGFTELGVNPNSVFLQNTQWMDDMLSTPGLSRGAGYFIGDAADNYPTEVATNIINTILDPAYDADTMSTGQLLQGAFSDAVLPTLVSGSFNGVLGSLNGTPAGINPELHGIRIEQYPNVDVQANLNSMDPLRASILMDDLDNFGVRTPSVSDLSLNNALFVDGAGTVSPDMQLGMQNIAENWPDGNKDILASILPREGSPAGQVDPQYLVGENPAVVVQTNPDGSSTFTDSTGTPIATVTTDGRTIITPTDGQMWEIGPDGSFRDATVDLETIVNATGDPHTPPTPLQAETEAEIQRLSEMEGVDPATIESLRLANQISPEQTVISVRPDPDGSLIYTPPGSSRIYQIGPDGVRTDVTEAMQANVVNVTGDPHTMPTPDQMAMEAQIQLLTHYPDFSLADIEALRIANQQGLFENHDPVVLSERLSSGALSVSSLEIEATGLYNPFQWNGVGNELGAVDTSQPAGPSGYHWNDPRMSQEQMIQDFYANQSDVPVPRADLEARFAAGDRWDPGSGTWVNSAVAPIETMQDIQTAYGTSTAYELARMSEVNGWDQSFMAEVIHVHGEDAFEMLAVMNNGQSSLANIDGINLDDWDPRLVQLSEELSVNHTTAPGSQPAAPWELAVQEGNIHTAEYINLLHETVGNNEPYMPNTIVFDQLLPPGTTLYSVENKGQARPGGWGANTSTQSQEELRRFLAVLYHWKDPDSSRLVSRSYQVENELPVRSGVIGPQLDDTVPTYPEIDDLSIETQGEVSDYLYPGGFHQYEYVAGRWDDADNPWWNYMRRIGDPDELDPMNPTPY